jgi:hypothetical protein
MEVCHVKKLLNVPYLPSMHVVNLTTICAEQVKLYRFLFEMRIILYFGILTLRIFQLFVVFNRANVIATTVRKIWLK